MPDWSVLNPEVIGEFRANGGKVARFGDLPVVLLHTLGARTGRLRVVPLIVVLDGEEMLLFGTNAGAKSHPDWVFNLRAHPRITVEYGVEEFAASVDELPEGSARQKREQQARSTALFADYVESAGPRVVPVFSIQRV